MLKLFKNSLLAIILKTPVNMIMLLFPALAKKTTKAYEKTVMTFFYLFYFLEELAVNKNELISLSVPK